MDLSTRFRIKRFDLFLSLLKKLKKTGIDIIDLGGTVVFWEKMNFISLREKRDINITLLNRHPQESRYGFIRSIVGDCRDLRQFHDKQFDIVFSNSVIEHLGSYRDQKKMAEEAQRIGKNYFIQTPNYYFPIEPHFLFPFFHFFPLSFKVFLLRHFNLGFYKMTPPYQEALRAINEIHLLKLNEFKSLFPDAVIYKEKFFGLDKSFVAYKF